LQPDGTEWQGCRGTADGRKFLPQSNNLRNILKSGHYYWPAFMRFTYTF